MNKTTLPEGNLLQYEKSPYLLQHALDPVHWQSWGEEAFAAARQEDKPVFHGGTAVMCFFTGIHG